MENSYKSMQISFSLTVALQCVRCGFIMLLMRLVKSHFWCAFELQVKGELTASTWLAHIPQLLNHVSKEDHSCIRPCDPEQSGKGLKKIKAKHCQRHKAWEALVWVVFVVSFTRMFSPTGCPCCYYLSCFPLPVIFNSPFTVSSLLACR